jgi:hypothetical protein
MMMRVLTAVVALALLASCGADGEPERPEPRPSAGVTLSGGVAIGVAGGS